MNHQWKCIDVGSDYCPCYLAETLDCITCSHLKGMDFCNCDWRGICIYQEFHFLKNQKKKPRHAKEVPIIKKEYLGYKTLVLTLKVSYSLARQLKQPGSYVFVRSKESNHFFDIPISIMDVDLPKHIIKIAIQIQGIKTKTIEKIENSLLIRGPYWNGIFGLEHLKQIKNSRCLVIARGIAQAPSVLVIKQMQKNNNHVDVIIDKGACEYNFISKYCDCNILAECNLYSPEFDGMINNLREKNSYSLFFIGGSDVLYKKMKDMLITSKDIKYARTNNNEVCCGEGICGACNIYDIDGNSVRSCKSQTSSN